MLRGLVLVALATLSVACGDNLRPDDGATRVVGGALVSGGVRASSAHFKLDGALSQGGGSSRSSSYQAHGGGRP
jgi:hypothetical protein